MNYKIVDAIVVKKMNWPNYDICMYCVHAYDWSDRCLYT